MNAFYVDADPVKAAQSLCDQHVVKMVLETAQILSTLARTWPVAETVATFLYRPTHERHPVVLAAARSDAYLDWLIRHGRGLAAEYEHRFGRVHASARVIDAAAEALGWKAHVVQLLKPGEVPLCLPDYLHGPDPVLAYRAYYRVKASEWAALGRGMRWTRREVPAWMGGAP